LTFFALQKSAYGQEDTLSLEAPFETQVQTAQRLRISGIVLTSIGSAVALAGGGVMIAAVVQHRNVSPDQPTMGGALGFVLGGAILGGAAAILATGVPLWVVGSKRLSSLEQRTRLAGLPMPTLAFNPLSSTYSVGLRGQF
jgi:hypothetical protein